MQIVRWLHPGMGVKRWLALVVAGVLVIGVGIALVVNVEILGLLERGVRQAIWGAAGRLPPGFAYLSGVLFVVLGGALVALGIRQTIRSLIGSIVPEDVHNLAELVYQRQHLKKGPRIVALGGGTGLATLLRGLKEYTSNITGVVTVTDDGGSSGRLRSGMGVLPPGDVRNTLVALADTEPLMQRLFQYRFTTGDGLAGHSFGNLFIAAMSEITGDFEQAIRESSKVLAIRGRVLPSTLQEGTLRARFADGTEVVGESRIPAAGKRVERVSLEPGDPDPVPEVLRAIAEADAVVLGPGSLYTSVLPNLLVRGISEAMRESRAIKIYVCNVMTQPGETDGYTASDHVRAVHDHVGPGLIDYVIANDQAVPPHLAEKYREQGAYPVRADLDRLRALGVSAIARPLISESDLVRHDPGKLAASVIEIVLQTGAAFEGKRIRDFYFNGATGGGP